MVEEQTSGPSDYGPATAVHWLVDLNIKSVWQPREWPNYSTFQKEKEIFY